MQAEMQKIKPEHLKREAFLYVRQSTPRQVLENQENTKRQYALRQRAIALGWHADHIVVIDNDLGHSAASAVDREGFKKLVAEVGMGHAGLVIGIEVSRLARKSSDWHRLLLGLKRLCSYSTSCSTFFASQRNKLLSGFFGISSLHRLTPVCPVGRCSLHGGW
jgi:hypothetical protein